MSELIKGWLCSKCGPLHYNEVDAVDQTVGCTRCGGVMTVTPLYTTDHAEELAKALEAIRKHQETMGGVTAFITTTWRIADKALTNYREATK